jgi:hypothetical protein
VPSQVTFETVRRLALALPGVEETTSYGTPSFKVKGKFLSRLKEDGETIVVKIDFDTRDMLMAAEPGTFYITDHYRGYPAVLVRLAAVRRDDLQNLLEEAWRQAAPKRLAAAYPGGSSGSSESSQGRGSSRPRGGSSPRGSSGPKESA